MLFAGVAAHHATRVCVTHGDHCLGLPGARPLMALDQVTAPVEVADPGPFPVANPLCGADSVRDFLSNGSRCGHYLLSVYTERIFTSDRSPDCGDGPGCPYSV
jgi:ribonuclease BN (tRNA processing enzyme)